MHVQVLRGSHIFVSSFFMSFTHTHTHTTHTRPSGQAAEKWLQAAPVLIVALCEAGPS